MPTVHEVAALEAACRHEAATACVSPAFQALFRVHTLSACDAFLWHLLSLHRGARAFFAHQAQLALKHARRAAAGAVLAPRESIELGGQHSLTLSAQPLVLMGNAPEQLVPALLIGLAFRDAARMLLCSVERAERCSQGLDEIAHMFSIDGRTVLYQNVASQEYLGIRCWTGLEALMGAAPFNDCSNAGVSGVGGVGGVESLLQQQPTDADDADDEVYIAGYRYRSQRGAWSAPASASATVANFLQQLFVLDGGSLEQMMAVTSQGCVWRCGGGD